MVLLGLDTIAEAKQAADNLAAAEAIIEHSIGRHSWKCAKARSS